MCYFYEYDQTFLKNVSALTPIIHFQGFYIFFLPLYDNINKHVTDLFNLRLFYLEKDLITFQFFNENISLYKRKVDVARIWRL